VSGEEIEYFSKISAGLISKEKEEAASKIKNFVTNFILYIKELYKFIYFNSIVFI